MIAAIAQWSARSDGAKLRGFIETSFGIDLADGAKRL
jgi:hypothetical protein